MRHPVLLLVCAAALSLSIGVAPASATVLCKTASTPCGSSNHHPMGTDIESDLSPGTVVTLESESPFSPTIVCTAGQLFYRTETTGDAFSTVKGWLLKWRIDNCSSGAPEDVALTILGTMEFHHISGTDNATITSTGLEFWTKRTDGVGEVWCKTLTPAGGIDFGILDGGEAPSIVVNAAYPTSPGCGLTVRISAKYDVTKPKPIYVASS